MPPFVLWFTEVFHDLPHFLWGEILGRFAIAQPRELLRQHRIAPNPRHEMVDRRVG